MGSRHSGNVARSGRVVDRSALTGRGTVALWAPAADTFPTEPAFCEYLADDLLWDRLDRLAARYRGAGYRLI